MSDSVRIHKEDASGRTFIKMDLDITGIFKSELMAGEMVRQIQERLVDAAVKEIMENRFNDILSIMDPRAIANLALARAANRVADELTKKQ